MKKTMLSIDCVMTLQDFYVIEYLLDSYVKANPTAPAAFVDLTDKVNGFINQIEVLVSDGGNSVH